MNNNDLFQKIKALQLPAGKYVLFGSAPLGVRNIKGCHDIDIVVTEDVYDAYKNKEGWKAKKMLEKSDVEYLRCGDIEFWKEWGPGEWNINELILEAEMINGLPFVRLEKVIEWKKLNAREKDLKDIETIEKFLRMQK